MLDIEPRAAHRRRAAVASCLLAAAGGAMDACVFIRHGHVFANAQTGNVVLAAIALAAGDAGTALRHLPSLVAFCAGILLSRLGGAVLKRRGRNSRTLRLAAEAVALASLGAVAGRLPDGVVTALVGFLAAVQITALSHIGDWSFNTGMTTGNLRSALSAASAVLIDLGNRDKRGQATLLGALCVFFGAGAMGGAAATFRWGDTALLGTAAAILAAAAVARDVPDPVP